MRNKIRSYLVFASFAYRLVVYLAIPAALVGFGVWAGRFVGEMGVMLVAMLLPLVETLSDYWLFGGLQSRDSLRLEYLKTSGRGMGILRDALWVDLFRKLLSGLIAVAGGYLGILLFGNRTVHAGMGSGMFSGDFISSAGSVQGMGILLYLVLVSYFASALCTLLSRYGGLLWLNLLLGYGGLAMVTGSMLLLGTGGWLLGINGVFCISDICVSGLAVKAAVKRTEGSYYDE